MQKFDKASDYATFNDLFDRRIAFFRQKLPELGSSIKLSFHRVGKDALNHLRELFCEL